MPAGRPTVMTEEIIAKLEEAFAMGCTDKEACFYAGIHPATLYDYQNINPEFIDRKESLKENPILLARKTILDSLSSDKQTAQWYLERKRKDEFSPRQEMTGKDGEKLTLVFDPAFNATSRETTPNSPEQSEIQGS